MAWSSMVWNTYRSEHKKVAKEETSSPIQKKGGWLTQTYHNIPILQMDGIYIPTLDTFGMVQPPRIFSLLASSEEW